MEPEGSLPCSQDPLLIPILSQMPPVHTFPPYLPKIHSNIILPLTWLHERKITLYDSKYAHTPILEWWWWWWGV